MVNIKVGLDDGVGTSSLIAIETKKNGQVHFVVNFANKKTVEQINKHLQTPRAFRIPQSSRIDDCEEIQALPTNNITFFQLALCTLWAETGIKVIW